MLIYDTYQLKLIILENGYLIMMIKRNEIVYTDLFYFVLKNETLTDAEDLELIWTLLHY